MTLGRSSMLGRSEVLALLDVHELRPSRALGQNFVADANTVRRIARLAGVGPGDRVVEIGAGLGSLTLALAETGAAVTAVELDRRLVPILRSVVGDRVTVVQADALTLDWGSLLGPERPGGSAAKSGVAGPERPGGSAATSGAAGPERPGGSAAKSGVANAPWTLVANLPYNVATPLVCDLLDGVPAISSMLVMVQREVGERLAASPGSPAYGSVSVKVAYWATARVVGRVPATVFVPRPRVESVLVSIVRRASPAVDPDAVDARLLWKLVRAGFGQRRKTLRRSLGGLVAPGDAAVWAAAGVDPGARAETLDVEAWGRLARAVGRGGQGTGFGSR